MNLRDLSKQIEALRKEMINTGLSKGLNSPETVKLSQNLDELLNLHMDLQSYLKS